MTPPPPSLNKAKFPSPNWLIATHAMLCLATVLAHLPRYPLLHSIYYWWIVPFDTLALLVVTPLYGLGLTAPWAFCLALVTSAAEWLALTFLGLSVLQHQPTTDLSGVLIFVDGLMVAARIPLGWFIANIVRTPSDLVQGCLQ